MADLRALKDKAADLAVRGKLDRSAEAYRSVVEADPADTATHQRLAEVLRRADRAEEAVRAYAVVAEQYAKLGLLAKAIAICKTVLELDPGHVTTQTTLAELYATRARTDRPARLTALHTPAVLVPGRGDQGPVLVPIGASASDSELVELPLDQVRPPALVPPPPPIAPPQQATEAPPAPRPPSGTAFSSLETPLAQIVSAAQAATAAGIEEDVILDLEDEPLEIVHAPQFHRAAEEPAEELEEAEIVGDEPLAAAAEPSEPELVADDEVLEAGPEAPGPAPAPRRGVAVPGDLALPRVPLFCDLSR